MVMPCTNTLNGQFEDYTVIFDNPTGIRPTIVDETPASIFPNPSDLKTSIQYEITQAKNVNIELFNLMGEKISTVAHNEHQPPGKYSYEIKVESPGTYLLKLDRGDALEVFRVVMIHN